jgi:diaminopimelate epimerase
MGKPVFALAQVPFDAAGLSPHKEGGWEKWNLALGTQPSRTSWRWRCCPWATRTPCRKSPTWTRARGAAGPADRAPFALSQAVNAGFMQVLDRARIKLRVWERGAGETLACGTGACAAVVAGIRLGRLGPRVDVETRGGLLTIEWAGGDAPVLMTGPAVTVFEGEIELQE